MPIKRKLQKFGGSRVIAIPNEWLEYYEEETGQTIDSLLMEINDSITLRIPKKKNVQNEKN